MPSVGEERRRPAGGRGEGGSPAPLTPFGQPTSSGGGGVSRTREDAAAAWNDEGRDRGLGLELPARILKRSNGLEFV